MRTAALGIAATTGLFATTVAAAFIWLTLTDPVGLAMSAASGNIWAILHTIAQRVLVLIW